MKDDIENWIWNGAEIGGKGGIVLFGLMAAREIKKNPQLAITIFPGFIGWGIAGVLVGAVAGGVVYGGKKLLEAVAPVATYSGKKLYNMFPSSQAVQNPPNPNQGQNQSNQVIAQHGGGYHG